MLSEIMEAIDGNSIAGALNALAAATALLMRRTWNAEGYNFFMEYLGVYLIRTGKSEEPAEPKEVVVE